MNLICALCSACGLVSLFYPGYIKAINVWSGQVWQSYGEDSILDLGIFIEVNKIILVKIC